MTELLSNTQFGAFIDVDTQKGQISRATAYKLRRNFDKFLERGFSLGDIIPCHDNGDPFREPAADSSLNLKRQYEEAKSRVLFEGFTYGGLDHHTDFLQIKIKTPRFSQARYHIEDKVLYTFAGTIHTIEDLVRLSPTITDAARKIIFEIN
jgi:hypothetical protein